MITILGSAGGVARAVLAVLSEAALDPGDPLHGFLYSSTVHLVDWEQMGKGYYQKLLPELKGRLHIHQFNLRNVPRLREHLRSTGTDVVVDVSCGDTLEILSCCNGLGVRYVNTALESALIDEQGAKYRGFTMIERLKAFESRRGDFTNTVAVVCSGMNPGVVQWMALELMKQRPGEVPLGCYIVEHDDSFFTKKAMADEETVYVTWAPECFLDEAILNYPMFVRNGTPVFLHDPTYALEFKVTLGSRQFSGCLMPHEEVFTLSRLHPMECGFIYRVNDHTTGLIRQSLDDVDVLWEKEMRVLDPAASPLAGGDLVGVVLVYKDAEYYMYNAMSNKEVSSRYGVNATYFQVACGVYSALATVLLDPLPGGVHFVDELLLNTSTRYGEFLTRNMSNFVVGRNDQSDGLLLERITRIEQ